jgi:hypothetical protein
MKQTTRQCFGIAAAAALVIGVANGVYAHGGYGPGFGPDGGGRHGMMGRPGGMHPHGRIGPMGGGYPTAYTEQGLDQLKTTLGIAAEQEAAWNAYVDAVKGKAALRDAHRQARFANAGVTPDERLKFHEEGLAQMQKVVGAGRDLYAVLTPEQQARAGGLIGPRCTAR